MENGRNEGLGRTLKPDIKSLTLPALADAMRELGEPAFRAKQIFTWLHGRQAGTFDEMTDLSKPLRGRLSEKYKLDALKLRKRLVSSIDGTVKYLYELSDGSCVETVFMRHRHGTSLCVSTQVGCRMGCRFCASTVGGLVRNLTPAEMLDQVYLSGKDAGERIDGVVLMGIGEPLDNYGNVLGFLRILSSPKGLGLSLRHVSLSTSGLVPMIDRLAGEKLSLTLSVSLHAPDNETRSAIMPVNNRWPVEELLAACKRYFEETGRRLSFEYALIAGENDAPEKARLLADTLRKHLGNMPIHVNLIPVNAVEGKPYARSDKDAIRRFQEELERRGLSATLRRELGSDIAAACGQLRRQESPTPLTLKGQAPKPPEGGAGVAEPGGRSGTIAPTKGGAAYHGGRTQFAPANN